MEKQKILIVNGDDYVRNTLFNCLKEDYEVTVTPFFQEALNIFDKAFFDVVITEINTPEIKGIEVLRKLKEINLNTPIIVVTTYDSVPLAVEAMKVGAYDYITKPFNLDELKLVIMHVAERQKLLDEVAEKKIYQELALLDGLTNIYNRRYFEELLDREVERALRYPQEFSLLMIDIDDFKKYNDTYGHLAGDNVLRSITEILLKKSRVTDFIARYGGEEFVIIAPHTDKKGATILAARIVDIVSRKEFILKNSGLSRVTVSIGVAAFKEDAATKEDLIQRADEALYQAKKLGKNKMCLFGTPA